MKLSPFFFFCCCLCFAQSPQTNYQDSTFLYINKAQIGNKYTNAKKAFEYSILTNKDSLIKVAAKLYGIQSYFNRDSLGLVKTSKKLKSIYEQKKDSFALAQAFYHNALRVRNAFLIDSAYYYYYQSKQISIQINDPLEAGKRLLSMAYIQKDQGDFLGAQASCVEGLKYIEPLKRTVTIVDFYNVLGITYNQLDLQTEARKEYEKALNLIESVSDKHSKDNWRAHLLNNISYSYYQEGDYKNALTYIEEGLSIDSIQYKFRGQYETLIGNKADCEYYLGNKILAEKLRNELLKHRQESNDFKGLAKSYSSISYYDELEGNLDEALRKALLGYYYAKKITFTSVIISSLRKLARLSKHTQAKKYFEEYVQLNDSLKQRERASKLQFAAIRYETDKKEKENQDLKLVNSQKELQIVETRQQNLIVWFVVLVLSLLLFVSYLLFRHRRKQLQIQSQLDRSKARERERKRIAKSLHDEVAGDLRILHKKLKETNQSNEAKTIDRIKENVRHLSHELSSVSFDEVSFREQLIGLFSEYMSSEFRIKPKGLNKVNIDALLDPYKRTLFLSIRECLLNTIKHAKASEFLLNFEEENNKIKIRISDNGSGIQEEVARGIGLNNIKERIEELDGKLIVNSSEKGTIIDITIPKHVR